MRDLSAPCILVLGNQSHTASEQALIQTPVYLLVSTTMNGAITLWCLVKGDTSLFKVETTPEHDIADLKALIQEERKNGVLGRVDATDLVLWKVCTVRLRCNLWLMTWSWKVNIDMNESFEDTLNLLELKDGIEGVQRLSPAKRLSNVFVDTPEEEHLHIVVERPATGAF